MSTIYILIAVLILASRSMARHKLPLLMMAQRLCTATIHLLLRSAATKSRLAIMPSARIPPCATAKKRSVNGAMAL